MGENVYNLFSDLLDGYHINFSELPAKEWIILLSDAVEFLDRISAAIDAMFDYMVGGSIDSFLEEMTSLGDKIISTIYRRAKKASSEIPDCPEYLRGSVKIFFDTFYDTVAKLAVIEVINEDKKVIKRGYYGYGHDALVRIIANRVEIHANVSSDNNINCRVGQIKFPGIGAITDLLNREIAKLYDMNPKVSDTVFFIANPISRKALSNRMGLLFDFIRYSYNILGDRALITGRDSVGARFNSVMYSISSVKRYDVSSVMSMLNEIGRFLEYVVDLYIAWCNALYNVSRKLHQSGLLQGKTIFCGDNFDLHLSLPSAVVAGSGDVKSENYFEFFNFYHVAEKYHIHDFGDFILLIAKSSDFRVLISSLLDQYL